MSCRQAQSTSTSDVPLALANRRRCTPSGGLPTVRTRQRHFQCTLRVYLLTYYTHAHPFNGPLSGTTQVSRYQKGKTNMDFTGARDSERQWHQLGHMQVCTSLQRDNHASTSLLKFFTGRMPFLPPNQQCQSTEGKSFNLDTETEINNASKLQHMPLRTVSNHNKTTLCPKNVILKTI